MEYIIFAAVMACIVILFMAKGIYDYKQSEKKFIRKRYSDYGVLPQREYKPEQFESISHYYQKHADGFCIDDITWNDLNMDEIFKKMNFTYSAAGEEYLYYVLRRPCMEDKELLHREEIIRFFQEHADERVAYQVMYHRLGRTGKFSIYDYLDHLDGLGRRSNMPHYLALILLAVSIGVLFTDVAFGILMLVCVLAFNNVSYFKVKGEIDPYIVSFAYVFRLLDAVKNLKSKVRKTESLKEEFEILRKSSASMGGFKRGSFILMSSGRMSGSGNPLDMLLDFIRMGFHLDLIKFNQMLAEVRKHIHEIDGMITIMGRVEALIAIGAYRESHSYCVPEFVSGKKIMAEGMYHPLIEDPVPNNIRTDKSVLITGSNASGKSTFLKTMAINAIFAQTIHTCLAERYVTGMFRVCSSMSLRDDVQGGSSYYMVEIKALKRILDLLSDGEEYPVLCFVDEVLRGTNTVERIAASTEILRSMAQKSCICFAATHDIELTHLLEGIYSNYHFEEEIKDNDILFSYKILNGRATTRNAIRLLGIMGYDEGIIREAEERANTFLKTGRWHG